MIPAFISGMAYQTGRLLDIGELPSGQEFLSKLKEPQKGLKTYSKFDDDVIIMAASAITETLGLTGLDASSIDLLLVASNLLDSQNNLKQDWLIEIAKKLNMQGTPTNLIGMSECAGFHSCLKFANAMINAGHAKNILVLNFDSCNDDLQRCNGEDSDFSYVTSDAASSCIVSDQKLATSFQILSGVEIASNTSQLESFSSDTDMRMIARLVKEVLTNAKLKADEIQVFTSNNYTLEATQLFCQLSGVSAEKIKAPGLPKYAHCFNSDNLINLKLSVEDISIDDNCLLFSTGVFQVGACIVKRVA